MTQYYWRYSNVSVPVVMGNPGGISNSATSIYATTTPAGYPSPTSSRPVKLRLEPRTSAEEIVCLVGGAGTSGSPWIIGVPGSSSPDVGGRGWDGTTAVAHGVSSPAAIEHGLTQEDLAQARNHEVAAQAQLPHALPSAAWDSPAYAQIGSTVLGGGTSTVITFSSITGIYKNLLVVIQGRGDDSSQALNDIQCQVNGDGGSFYSEASIFAQNLTGSLGGPSVTQDSSSSFWKMFSIAASLTGSGRNAGAGYAIIPNYADNTFDKGYVSHSGFGNGTSTVFSCKSRWGWYHASSAAAITQLDFTIGSGHYKAGTYIGLFGFGE